MQVGGQGGVKSDINITPLIDVILVLLIIFMVITPVVQMGYLVRVPPRAPADLPPSVVPDQIVLSYFPDGRMLINKEEVTAENLPSRLRDILRGNTGKMVFFKGDPELTYNQTLTFLDLARSSGAQNIGIIVE